MKNKLIVAALILVSTHGHTNSVLCTDAQRTRIERSVGHYLNNSGSSTLRYNQVTLLSIDCAQDYAKAIIHPKNKQTDDATIYLQKGKDGWQILALGTFFEPEFLATIPKALH